MQASFNLNLLALQPTSLCNLNCSYCYLEDRAKNRRMPVELTARLAGELAHMVVPGKPLEILWHCGEPLACGLAHFERLIAPFWELERRGAITHTIQTNATLINKDWCEFFKKHNFSIGVSLDGPEWANSRRVNWTGRAAFGNIMTGIDTLKRAGLDFGVIAVVSRQHLGRAAELYQFFAGLGCSTLSINLEEEIGLNREVDYGGEEEVRRFWSDLFTAWEAHPAIYIREIHHYLNWRAGRGSQPGIKLVGAPKVELVPTLGWQGDIVFLSPELLGVSSAQYHNFVVGNIFKETFQETVERAKEVGYVQDFIQGKLACRDQCPFYAYCRGGYASNKFFETGSTRATQTVNCRNSRQLLVETLGSLV